MKNFLTFCLLFTYALLTAQSLRQLQFAPDNPLAVTGFIDAEGREQKISPALPLFSFELNRRPVSTTDPEFLQNIQYKTLDVRTEAAGLPADVASDVAGLRAERDGGFPVRGGC